MKVAFYVPNSTIKNIDLSDVQNANPGIGGTEYAFFALCYYLSLYSEIELSIFTNAPLINYKANVNNVLVDCLSEALLASIKNKINILVVHHSNHSMSENAFDILAGSNVSVILWVHNFLDPKVLSYYGKNPQIKRIVFVGREFLNCYRDHLAFEKSTYIYNGIKLASENRIPYTERPNYVTYIGNLIPGKGFHLLAKSWKSIVREVPDAQLHVIGSGKLYDRNATMGKYGLAQKEYEDKFMKYLQDDEGNLLDSVKFHGILGKEKNEIIRKTKVGVPNPSGYSETFGYTAVEMELFDCLVTTIRCPGYLDTVSSVGILFKNPSCLSKSVVTLLRRDKDVCQQHFLKKFDFNEVSKQWEKLLEDVYSNKSNIVDPYKGRGAGTYSLEILRRIKKYIPLLSCLPTVEGIKYNVSRSFFRIGNKIKNAKKRIAN